MLGRHGALLGRLLVVSITVACVSAVGLPKYLRLPALSECHIGGVKFSGLGHYINGSQLEPGSIYADCVYGITTCYQDDGTTSKEGHQQVHCPTGQAHAATYGKCRVGGVEFDGLAHYVVGRRRLPGSVYADCIHGEPRCFVDDAIADKMDVKIACDDVEIETWRRRLGLFDKPDKGVNPWPHRVVCYSVVSTFSEKGMGFFQQAFREFQDEAKITFIKIDDCKATYGDDATVCGGCKSVLSLRNDKDGCNSNVGFMDTPTLNLGNGCEQYNTYVHELGHAVGLLHEHAHPDRQVIMLRDKLRQASVFYTRSKTGTTTPYSMGSVMHYDGGDMCLPKDASVKFCDVDETEANGCVVPKDEHCDAARQNEFGQAPDLAPSDAEAINAMYAGIDPHPKSPQVGSSSASAPSPSPPGPASTETTAPRPPAETPPPTTTAPPPPAETPPPATTTPPPPPPPTPATTAPPTPPTPSTTTTTPATTLPGINFENIYDVLAKLGDLLSKRRIRLRH